MSRDEQILRRWNLSRRPASRAERVIHMLSQRRTVAASLLIDDDRPAALDVQHPA
jgi:hypothetical protein